MSTEQNFPDLSSETAQVISDQIKQWWHHPEQSQLSSQEIAKLIQQFAQPPSVWYYIPEQDPYNSMEAWCEGELECDADYFLETLQSRLGEQVIAPLRDRRLSAIFRPLP